MQCCGESRGDAKSRGAALVLQVSCGNATEVSQIHVLTPGQNVAIRSRINGYSRINS